MVLAAPLNACDALKRHNESEQAAAPGTPVQVLEDPARVHEAGEQAEARDFVMSYAETAQCQVEQHLRPRPGWAKLGVRVTLKGTSEREVPVNPFYASLEAKNGNAYETTLAGCRPQLRAQRVAEGRAASGWITFDVPEGVREFVLSYRPTVIGSAPQEVKFRLSL